MLALPLLAVLHAIGQTTASYIEKLTVDDGLSSQEVMDMAQDDRGFLWIATTNGLNRYDGKEVVHFLADGTDRSLPDNGVNCLAPTHKGQLVIGTNQGIAVLDLGTGKFRTVHLARKDPSFPYADRVQHLTRDQLGQYWASTPTSIFRLDSNMAILDVFNIQQRPMDSRFMNVFKMFPLPGGMTIFWAYSGLYCWLPDGKGLRPMGPEQKALLQFLKGSAFDKVELVDNKYLVKLSGAALAVCDLLSGRSSQLSIPYPADPNRTCGAWGSEFAVSSMIHGGAVYRLDSIGPRLTLEAKLTDWLTAHPSPKIFRDDEGNIWLRSEHHELIKVARDKQLFHHADLFAAGSSDIAAAEVIDIFPLGATVLAGTFGNGYYQVDPSQGTTQQFTVRTDSLSENIVWHIKLSGGDTLWIATQEGIVCHALGNHPWGRLPMPHPELLDSVPITTLFTDSRGWVWMGLGKGNGVAVFDARHRTFRHYPFNTGAYPYRYPLNAREDATGNVWFISDVTGDLVRWDQSDGNFHKVVVPLVDGAVHYQTGGFFLDKQKEEIWYGVESVGLARYRIRDHRCDVFNAKDGLTTGAITGITKDKYGRLWLGTSQGLTCFNPGRGQVINYNKSDGLPSSGYTSELLYDTLRDRIYAGSSGALTWFQVPDSTVDDKPMRIYLTDFKINGQATIVPGNASQEFGPEQNNVFVKFTAINLSNGKENRYEYRLNNGPWSNLGNETAIRLASLKPGTYSLMVRAAHKQGRFGPGRSILQWTIRPYFTDTLWFYLLCIAAVAAPTYAWYRYRLRQLQKLEAMRSRISRDLHDEIGSRLTNINMMSQIIRQDPVPRKKELLLGKIQEESEEITRSMREIIWDIDPQNDHWGTVMPRMVSFASQLLEAGNIEVEARIGKLEDLKLDMSQRRDLFLIFKEAVHNIAKHSGATKAVILSTMQDGQFQLRVEDNGRGLDRPANGHEGGLRYMRQRADSHGWKLEISSLAPGTAVTVRIPVKA